MPKEIKYKSNNEMQIISIHIIFRVETNIYLIFQLNIILISFKATTSFKFRRFEFFY